jgi:hypothetical protein
MLLRAIINALIDTGLLYLLLFKILPWCGLSSPKRFLATHSAGQLMKAMRREAYHNPLYGFALGLLPASLLPDSFGLLGWLLTPVGAAIFALVLMIVRPEGEGQPSASDLGRPSGLLPPPPRSSG